VTAWASSARSNRSDVLTRPQAGIWVLGKVALRLDTAGRMSDHIVDECRVSLDELCWLPRP